ncbi:family 43 glycosylhydrolase [Nocardioides gansuensis]|uniref:family 43 glycosylhydrolase n=1 Tax=Nocardioides gansuensis TaxID=2138300 RepID=UPI001BAA3F28|nr:family 43 glycosylhydrolase [Nocardioides gansuensis]
MAATTLLAAVGAGLFVPSAPADPGDPEDRQRAVAAPRPVIWDRDFGDPSVVHDGTRWFGAATGWRARTSISTLDHGGWLRTGDLLNTRPAWARFAGVWAPEVEKAPDGSWLAYYTMPVKGMPHAEDRCIGVAVAPSLDAKFTPLGSRPLVCPSYAPTEPAGDQVAGRAPELPQRGVIDPSSYIAADGRRFLLYRTQGTPSTIRMVRLSPNGRYAVRRSRELLRDPGVLENPTLVKDRGWHYLMTSKGAYSDCRYRTVWRRSRWWHKGWEEVRSHVLLNRQRTGVCGPGGADYVPPTAGAGNRLFFHGWVCKGTNLPCYQSYQGQQDYEDVGKRALYAVRLRWRMDGPSIAAFVQGPPWTPPPPTPTPTPTTTPSPTPTPTTTPSPTPTPTTTPSPTPTPTPTETTSPPTTSPTPAPSP